MSFSPLLLCKGGKEGIKNCIRTGWNETEDKIVMYDHLECLYYLIRFIFVVISWILLIEKQQYIELEDPKLTVIRQAITDEQTPATIQPNRWL